MSLEEALVDHTAALRENSDLLRVLTGKAKAGLADAGGKAADSADKPATTRGRASPKAKAPTTAQMKEAAEKYLDVQDEAQYSLRRDNIKSIVKKFDATKFTEIAEENRQAALDLLAKYEADEDKDAGGGDGGDDLV